MKYASINDLNVKDKKVLLRVDFNVPLTNEGAVSDDTRIQAAIPTIQHLIKNNAKVVIISHLGRPKGEKIAKFTLKPVAAHLSNLLGKPVTLTPDCRGSETTEIIDTLQPGEIALLENIRYEKGEEDPECDPSLATDLAAFGDFYINDAFGVSHRNHTSTVTLPGIFGADKGVGFLMEKEIKVLGELLSNPEKPFYALIGGAKISSKLSILKNLLEKTNAIFIGGGMVYTFLKGMGIEIGDSIFEQDLIEEAKKFLELAKSKNVSIHLPEDFVCANRFNNNAEQRIVTRDAGIPVGWQGLDIGPETSQKWRELVRDGKTIFWNGPLGVFEFSNFSCGTNVMAQGLAQCDAKTVVGGGDSVAAINSAGLAHRFSHISTGGGATLEMIEFGTLPGIEALKV